MESGESPTFTTISAGIEDRLGSLVLDRPEKLNPISSVTLKEIIAAAAWFDTTDAVAVVVSGSGRAFSGGFDLREFANPDADPLIPELGAKMADAVADMRAVSIAAVNGVCVGGGFVLMMACDLRLAHVDAWFRLPETELGIPLAWTGVPRLVREVGPARALDLVLTAREINAQEAMSFGLLTRLVESGHVLDAATELGQLLVSRDPSVVATTKRQVAEAAQSLVPTSGHWAGTELLARAVGRKERN